MSWQPILDGQLRERAIDAMAKIAAEIGEACAGLSAYATSHAELATLFGYLDRANVVEGDASVHLERAIDTFGTRKIASYLFGGIAGIGWTYQHLLDEETANELCNPIDQFFAEELDTVWRAHYGLVDGLVGIGVYCASRPSSPDARLAATRVLDHLQSLSQPGDPMGRSWWTSPELIPEHLRASYPDGWLNLGVSHGMPGIIGMLARNVRAGIEVDRSTRLLRETITYLLASTPPRAPRFADCLQPGIRDSKPTRLAWCYGDAGISLVLLEAARVLDDRALETTTIDLALAMTRRPFEESGVSDPGLCHGASGIAHVFNRLYQATRLEPFADAARVWIERTLSMQSPGVGIGGFTVGDDLAASLDPLFLTGANGIALALLSAATDIEPGWDGRMLCDVQAV